jgi:hypothetical protein
MPHAVSASVPANGCASVDEYTSGFDLAAVEVITNLEKSADNPEPKVVTWPATTGLACAQYCRSKEGVRWEGYLIDRTREGSIKRAVSRDRTGLTSDERNRVEKFEYAEGPVSCTPSGELADVLTEIDLTQMSDYGLVETVADWDRIIAWAQGNQLAVVSELAAREAMYPELPEYSRSQDACIVGEELAFRLRCTRQTGRRMADMAIAFDGVLTATGDALRAGDIDLPRAQVFYRALSEEQGGASLLAALTVQDALLPIAAERTPPQLARDVQRALLLADPENAEAAHEVARRHRRVCRPRILPGGMAGTWMVLPAIDAVRLDVALDGFARASKAGGDERTMDQLRADVIADWAARALAGLDPIRGPVGDGSATDSSATDSFVADGSVTDGSVADGSGCGSAAGESATDGSGCGTRPVGGSPPPSRRISMRSQIRVTVPLNVLMGESDEPAELAGYGPITPSAARAIARDGVWRRIVTDPLSGAVLDVGRTRYRPPPDLAEFVRCRDGTCVRPGCGVRADAAELDHTIEWQDDGKTSADNLGCMCARDHRIKTSGGFVVTQVRPGEFEWRTPTGHVVRFQSQTEIDRLIEHLVASEKPLVDEDLQGILDGTVPPDEPDDPPF